MQFYVRCSVSTKYGPHVRLTSVITERFYWGEAFFLSALHALERVLEEAMAEGAVPDNVTMSFDCAAGQTRNQVEVAKGQHTKLVKSIVGKMRFLLAEPNGKEACRDEGK